MSGRSGSGGGGGSAGGGSSGAGPSRGRRLSVGAGPSQSYPGPDDDAGLLNKLLKRRSSGAMQLPQVRARAAASLPSCLPTRLPCLPAFRAAHPPPPPPARLPLLLQQPLSSAQLRRNRDKLVALLEEGQYSLLNGGGEGGGPSPQPSPVTAPGLAGDDELLPAAVEETPPAYMGRIAIHATAARWVGDAGRAGCCGGVGSHAAPALVFRRASCTRLTPCTPPHAPPAEQLRAEGATGASAGWRLHSD